VKPAGPVRKAGVGRFRVKLLVAMMVVVGGMTTGVLYFAQRSAESGDRARLHNEFQAELGRQLGSQEARRSLIGEWCQSLARSVRIVAALEEGEVADLYRNAELALHHVLDDDSGSAEHGFPSLLRARTFRFLDASGAVIPVSSPSHEEPVASWERQLVLEGIPADQESGYVVALEADGTKLLNEVIITPIVSTSSGETLGAIALLFSPVQFGRERRERGMRNGIFVNDHLHMESHSAEDRLFAAEATAAALGIHDTAGPGTIVAVGGTSYLAFSQAINPGSPLPTARQVCFYPIAESLARRAEQQRRILGTGMFVLLASLIASSVVSARLSKPVEQLAEVSAENAVQRERAEAALELTEKRTADELRMLNAGLQRALHDLKTTQLQVIQQERLRALGEMASGVAHDFNNALTPILGYSELLMARADGLDRQTTDHHLKTIHTSATDAASVVSRLRTFYRTTAEGDVFRALDLNHLAAEVVTLTQPRWRQQAQSNGVMIDVATALDHGMPSIAGDASALREMLTNLVFNAVDAMPSGGTITIRTYRRGNAGVLEVSDVGIGMTEEVRHRCLDPFFSTKGERGTGLGLSMVFGIIQRHCGTLEIRSKLNEGTTFVISLPTTEQTVVSTQGAESCGCRTSKQSFRVLVVDDEESIRTFLTAVLKAEGHAVEQAGQGLEALKLFHEGLFDLVITDKAMPGMNGDQLATAIKQVSPTTPVILLTGFGQFLDKSTVPDVDFLASKPISIDSLREAIATATRKAA
jgi:signal transduction histidine kinase